MQACVSIQNYTVNAQGTCGCVQIELDVFSVKLKADTGCFAFGTPQCPFASCGKFSNSCGSCDALPNCGYCAGPPGAQGKCLSGTQTGPSGGASCSAADWHFHRDQCQSVNDNPLLENALEA